MEFLKRFFDTGAGKIVAGLILVFACAAIYWEIRNTINPPAMAALQERIFICSETGKSFTHVLQVGDRIPLLSPFSGKNTGYPAELCYWNKDGTYRTDNPTPVLLNSWIGKSGPTFCPDCGRLVVARNPMPGPNVRPPPTREEWEQTHLTSSQ